MANPGPSVVNTTNTTSPRSTESTIQTIAVNLGTITSVPTITTSEKTFTGLGTGLLAGDVILSVSKPTTQAGLGISGWRVDTTTADTFYISYVNPTAAGITPTAAETYLITVARFISSVSTTPGTFSTLPASITAN
jgi:hypothetical protein